MSSIIARYAALENQEPSSPSPAVLDELQRDASLPEPGLVTVLMATCNGERFLAEQLDSLEAQTWGRIDLVVSDDGSRDRTAQEVETFSGRWTKGRLEVAEGPCGGFAANFRSLIVNSPVHGEYVAFCDQDDIWRPAKLERAIEWLAAQPADTPALYCGRTQTLSADGNTAMSPLFPRAPAFTNALVQSIAGANTMVMNRKAFELVREAARRTHFVSHDWWSYLIVAGAGGTVRYCAEPDVLYRQHEHNLVGANNTWRARMSRLKFLLSGRFGTWSAANLTALDQCRDLLTPQALACMDAYRQARRGPLFSRLSNLKKSGVYRQTWYGQVSLVMACILGLM